MTEQADDREQSRDGVNEETPTPQEAGDNVDPGDAASASQEEAAAQPDPNTAAEPAADKPAGDAAWSEALAETEDADETDAGESPERNAAQSTAHPADFPELGGGAAGRGPGNIDLLMDVKLPVSIELGRTTQPISEILQWGQGSIVELDKLAGEPVNLLVNNRLVARGEVVVVDENFGLRITALVSGRGHEVKSKPTPA